MSFRDAVMWGSLILDRTLLSVSCLYGKLKPISYWL